MQAVMRYAVMAYSDAAYIVMAYVVMPYIVVALYSYGLCLVRKPSYCTPCQLFENV